MVALKGAEGTLEKQSRLKMIIEFWPTSLEKAGWKPEELPAFLRRKHFNIFEVNEGRKKTLPFDFHNIMKRCESDEDQFTSLLCIKE